MLTLTKHKYYYTIILIFMSLSYMNTSEAHVHGQAKASLVLDNEQLNLSVTISAYDLVGFEHSPQNQEQKSIIDSVLSELKSHAKWIDFTPQLCELSDMRIINPFSEHEVHDEHHHSDFEISADYLCKKPEDLRNIEIRIQKLFSKIKSIELQWLAHNKQGLTILTESQQKVIFDD